VGEQSPGVRRAAAQMIVDLVNYRDLFTTDRVPADLRPWGLPGFGSRDRSINGCGSAPSGAA
jgi:hypothetical protein